MHRLFSLATSTPSMNFDHQAALRVVHDAVRRGDLAESMSCLLASCRAYEPDLPVWAELTVEQLVRDAERVGDQLAVLLDVSAVPAEFTGFYFGLHADGIRRGRGIGFGCTKHWAPSARDCEWACTCDRWPGALHSEVLVQLYRQIREASRHDYVLCFGFLGLALRRAFERLPLSLLLGGARERGVCWGFDEGDLNPLGRITADGFVLELEYAAPAPAVRELPTEVRLALDREAQERERFAAHVASGELEAAETLLERRPYLASLALIEAQWKAGRSHAWRRTVELYLGGSIDPELRLANAKSQVRRYGEVVELFDRLRDREARDEIFAQLTSFLSRAASASFVDPWVKTCSFLAFAEILDRRGDAAGARGARETAERWAEEQSRARQARDFEILAWRTMAEGWEAAGEREEGLRCAERIPDRMERLCAKASILMRANEQARAEALFAECRGQSDREELARVIARERQRRARS
jgi:hypothetical protein